MAAAAGDSNAMWMLGQILVRDANQDPDRESQGALWLTQSDEKGNLQGSVQLVFYDLGRHAFDSQTDPTTLARLKALAEKGSTYAMYDYSMRTFDEDYNTGLLWMKLAVTNGNFEALSVITNLAPGEIIYIIKKGDSLNKIAVAHGVTLKSIEDANNLSPTKLKVGQALRIPLDSAANPVQ